MNEVLCYLTKNIIPQKEDESSMRKKSNKSILNGLRWVYVIYAVLALILFALVLFIPSISDAFKKAIANTSMSVGDVSIKTFLLISLGISMLFDFWYFYLLSRFTDGKSKGTLLFVLLVLGVVTGIINVITTKNFSDASLVIDAVTLFYFIRYKKEIE